LINNTTQPTNQLILRAKICQGFDSLALANVWNGGFRIRKGKEERGFDISKWIKTYYTTIRKADNSMTLADEETSQGHEDMKFPEALAPIDIDCLVMAWVVLYLEECLLHCNETLSPCRKLSHCWKQQNPLALCLQKEREVQRHDLDQSSLQVYPIQIELGMNTVEWRGSSKTLYRIR
jgi:hypothetical protein